MYMSVQAMEGIVVWTQTAKMEGFSQKSLLTEKEDCWQYKYNFLTIAQLIHCIEFPVMVKYNNVPSQHIAS